jgi:hypothetical protein
MTDGRLPPELPAVESDVVFGCSSVVRIRLFFSWSGRPWDEDQAADEKEKFQAGSGLMIRLAVSPWSFAQAEKKAARRCDTIRASLQVHPSTRHARRAGLAVAVWRSTCWLSITLFSV